jgi:hypothetical protein
MLFLVSAEKLTAGFNLPEYLQIILDLDHAGFVRNKVFRDRGFMVILQPLFYQVAKLKYTLLTELRFSIHFFDSDICLKYNL